MNKATEEEIEKAKRHTLAVILYNPDHEGDEVKVYLTPRCLEMLSLLTDFELKVFAAETGIAVRKKFEMPPSPKQKE